MVAFGTVAPPGVTLLLLVVATVGPVIIEVRPIVVHAVVGNANSSVTDTGVYADAVVDQRRRFDVDLAGTRCHHPVGRAGEGRTSHRADDPVLRLTSISVHIQHYL